jgi:three-Cys-motif partner protein
MVEDTQHAFGGVWTQIKLSVLQDYLRFYTQALKNQRFRKIYIDAFAGSGECDIETPSGQIKLAGSAKIALDTDPAFDAYHFIEQHEGRSNALLSLCAQYPHETHVYRADANQQIIQLCNQISWRGSRATMFLDPYGLGVRWQTLQTIADTRGVDLWYLFSLSSLYRQAARRLDRVDEHKAYILDRCLGTTQWRDALYRPSAQGDLFGDQAVEREAGWRGLLDFVRTRLGDLFPRVTDPLILRARGARGAPFFALFFAVSNPSPKAQALSLKVANHILKQAQ